MVIADCTSVCIITGGNSGIGLAIAENLANKKYSILLGCRNSEKATWAVEKLRQTTGNHKIDYLPLNLASLASVRQFVQEIQSRQLKVNLLINNAGIFDRRGKTEEGFELIWGVNYLGHFLLTYLLLEKLKQSASSRIILVSSDLAFTPKSIPWDSFRKPTPWNFIQSYGVSKLCLLVLMSALKRELEGTPLTVNAVHPGFVRSQISIGHQLSRFLRLGKTPEQGAYSAILAATNPKFAVESGYFLGANGEALELPELAKNIDSIDRLWKSSLNWTGCNLIHQKNNTKQKFSIDPNSGILHLSHLQISPDRLVQIRQIVETQILPKPPHKHLIAQGFKFLISGKLGCLFLLLVQWWKKEYHMERHLDCDPLREICADREILNVVKSYLGEDYYLWRSEIWQNLPSQQLIPLWHQDSYPKLLQGTGKTIHLYIALTEVNKHNGFEYLPHHILSSEVKVNMNDPFSGNPFFTVPESIEKLAIPVVLQPGEFIAFTDRLIHRSVPNLSGKVRLSLTLRFVQSGMKVLPNYSPVFSNIKSS